MRTPNTRAAVVLFALFVSLVGARGLRAQETEAAREAARARETRRRPARGSITGRVVGEGGEPLAHVAVQLRQRGVSPGNASRAAALLVTDEEGNFAANDLAAGTYAVWAGHSGYFLDPEQASAAQRGYRLGDFVMLRMLRGGVITGTVTDASGAPLVALGVAAVRVRDHEGRPTYAPGVTGPMGQTDDRGVYRIYGLPPGVYVVVTKNAQGGWGGAFTAYEGDAPTFFPSATRDTAAEVTVRAGQEAAGIDIRYREERGRRVSGTLALPAQVPGDAGINLALSHAGSGMLAAGNWLSMEEGANAFALEGIADGDYELQAQLLTRDGPASSSTPVRVAVRGADVTGLRLTLAPLASAAGSVTVEPAPEALRLLPACRERAPTMLAQEALVVARRDVQAGAQPAGRGALAREAAPEESGAFTLRNLEPGAYRFEARPLDENFYALPFQLPSAPRPAAANTPRASGPVPVAAGQQVSGLSVRLAAGAAGAAGRVAVAETPGTPAVTFSALRLHLVPVERERSDEPAFYYETAPQADGSFDLKHLAPGRYLLLARASDAAEVPPRPAAWDADSRARLRREAEAAGLALDLQPCQRASDLTLRYPPAPGK